MLSRGARYHLVTAAVLVSAASVAAIGQPFDAYTEEAASRGLVYQMMGYPQEYGYLGFGCGFADLDSDGDPDAIVIGGPDPDGPGPQLPPVGIFENDGTGHFIDRTLTSGIAGVPTGSAFAAADYDGDGDVDLYLTQVGAIVGNEGFPHPNFLYRNEGGFQFTDVTGLAMAADFGTSKAACFADYDGDGWLDLYVCNYNGQTPGTEENDNRLYRNLGDGTFSEVATAQGVDSDALSFQAVWFDYDRDGDVDLYLSNDRGHLNGKPNQLWRNDGGELVDVSEGSGADMGLFSMGVACGDFDGNGWPDLYTTNIGTYDADGDGENDGLNPLFLNQGDGTFVESSIAAGVAQFITSWGAVFFDFDNDGPLELYVNNMFQPNTFYRHGKGFPCDEIAADLGVQGPVYQGSSGVSFSAAVADVDGDGRLDIIENNLGENVRLYMNQQAGGHWIRYDLVGLGANLFAVGASVDTRIGSVWRFREVYAGGNGYLGQNELTVHVGMGEATVADEVVVRWPGGRPTRTLTGLPADENWTIYPPERLGDAGGDGTVGLADLAVFAGCLESGFGPGCEMMDFDGDSDLDDDDVQAFLAAWSGTLYDCDGGGEADVAEILADPGLDANGNGIPDGCEAGGDVDGNGVVDVQDLVTAVLNFGPCSSPCFGDTNGDGEIDVDDLIAVILGWS